MLYHFPGALDVVGFLGFHQTLHHEGFEQFDGHFFGHTALIHLQFRANHDNATTGIVHTFPQQVLTEPALLAFQHIGQALQRTVVGTGHRTSPAAVVNQRVHRFLQHPLFIADDDVGSVELQQAL